MAETKTQTLQSLLGPAGVRDGHRPVALPEDAEQAAAVMRLAVERRWWVAPIGAGSWLGEPRADLLLSAERMTRLEAYEPADPMASVGAGMTLAALQTETAKQRQWLPVDPPADARATVGATVSLGAAGPLRLGYGTIREHVLGLELVSGDGRVLSLGGKVLKNVAGYDLTRLVIGSRGALGLVTRVHLKLRPRPEADRTACFSASELGGALGAARKALTRPEAVAVELLSPSLSLRVRGVKSWSVLVRLQGEHEAVAAARAAVGFEDADESAWSRLSSEELSTPFTVRLSQRASELPRTFALAAELGSELFAAHVGDGIVRVFVTAPDDTAVARARGMLAQTGGSVIALPPRRDVASFGPAGPAAPLMRKLKATFDPHGVLSDGGFGFLTG